MAQEFRHVCLVSIWRLKGRNDRRFCTHMRMLTGIVGINLPVPKWPEAVNRFMFLLYNSSVQSGQLEVGKLLLS